MTKPKATQMEAGDRGRVDATEASLEASRMRNNGWRWLATAGVFVAVLLVYVLWTDRDDLIRTGLVIAVIFSLGRYQFWAGRSAGYLAGWNKAAAVRHSARPQTAAAARINMHNRVAGADPASRDRRR